MTVEAIHIHEDDWGMRNLYPIEAADEAAAELRAAHEAGERNRLESGFGYADMHVIKPPAVDYVSVGLDLAAAATALEPIMPRVRIFNATISSAIGSEDRDPYGSYETEAWCFARSCDCFVKLEPAGDRVAGIWFELAGGDAGDAAAMRAAIEAIDRLAPSYLVDHWLSFACPTDPASLDAYFAAHAADVAEARRRAEQWHAEQGD